MKTPFEAAHPSTGTTLNTSPIRPYYLAALIILIFIASASYFGLRQINLQQDANTVLINVSGHQRALSLNIMLISTLLIQETDSAKTLSLKAQLSDLIAQMQAEHNDLINGTLPGSLSYPLSPTMKEIYFDASPSLAQQVKDYLLWASHLSTAPASELTANHPDYLALLNAWPEFLTALDNAVTQYGIEIAQRAARAREQEIIFLMACLGVAGIVTRYIFLILERSIQSDQRRMLGEIDMHREAEQILLRNETLYRLLAQNLPNTAVLLFDQDLRYLVVEGAIMEQAGFPKDRMEGKTLHEVVSPQTAQWLMPFYQSALEGRVSDFQFTTEKDITYQIHSVPIKADQDRILGGMLTIQDITQRQRTEEKLREREHFIEQIAATVPDVIYIYDLPEHRNVYANRDIGEIIGYNAAEVEAMGGRFMATVIHPDDQIRFVSHLEELSQASPGDSLEFEYRMKTRQSEWRWFNSRNTIFLRDEQGAVTQILGVARDIDRRKQTEENLQRREHIIQQIATTVPDIIYIYDFDLRRNVYANRPFGGAIGYDSATIAAMGENFMRDTMHPDDWERFQTHFGNLAVAADNTILEFEYRMKTPQGSWRWLNSRDIIFNRLSDGRVSQILGVARDITDWKIARDALQESEARFRQIAENVRSVFFILGADTRETLYVSPAYETIWGHSPAENYANPMAFSESIHPDDLERVLQERKQKMMTGGYNIEYRIIRPDGTIRWVHSRAYPVMNDQGVIERIIGISDDITERKELEQQAFAIAVEREHVRVLSTFIQDTSHDLRTPLTIMTTSLYLLRRLTDPEKQAERIDQIEKQMNHLNRIIGDLHEMSRLDIVEELQLSSVDVNRLVKNLSSQYQNIVFKKDHSLALNLGENLPLIQADAEQINHALINILDNAILYTKAGGTITITTARDNKYVIIAIWDKGIGIAPEHHASIFDRFYKVDAARTSGQGGPGLGLAMVKRIVEIHGGRVDVKSTLGEGSVFQLYLPIAATLDR